MTAPATEPEVDFFMHLFLASSSSLSGKTEGTITCTPTPHLLVLSGF